MSGHTPWAQIRHKSKATSEGLEQARQELARALKEGALVRYRNVRTGRIAERHAADEWLEASAGWERLDEPRSVRKPKADPAIEADTETPDAGDEAPDNDHGDGSEP